MVRDFDDRTMLVLALVENLQRTNLNPLEEARGYKRLIDEFNLTHQQVADAVGKDRTTITNLLRILALPDVVQKMVEGGGLSTGHARASGWPIQGSWRTSRLPLSPRLNVRELELVRDRTAIAKNRPARANRPRRQPPHR
jgi:ParB family chromosome partitioning protein